MSFFQNFVGNTLFVDANPNFGNDSMGRREDPLRPFLTLEAALAAAEAGDLVFLRPGIYSPAAGVTIPDGVAVRGASLAAVLVQMLGVTGPTTLVTMGEDTRVEDLSLLLTSAAHHDLEVALFPGTTAATAKIRTLVLTVDNSGAGAGTSRVCGILVQSSGVADRHTDAVRACTVKALSAGSGKKRGILMDTLAGSFRSHQTNYLASGGTDSIGAEIDIAGGTLEIDGRKVEGGVQDIKQTAGMLIIGPDMTLANVKANGSPFATERISSVLPFAISGGVPSGVTRFLRTGTDPVSTTEIFVQYARKQIAKSLTVTATTAPGAGKTDTFTLRKNGIDTGLALSISGTATTATFDSVSVDFLSTDKYSMKLVTDAGSGLANPVLMLEMYG
ncbi:MAG TPA: hypothetical protein VJB14_17645 [Planctomycetota bacterium]|nr:hypothetical protein [Planctomycetota bacterium]